MNYVSSDVLGRLVSGYAAVRYEAITEVHRTAAMELGKRGLFRMQQALLSYEN